AFNTYDFAYLLQGTCSAVVDTEPQAQYILFPVSKCIQYIFKLFLQKFICCMIRWTLRFLILYEIPQMAVILFTDRCFEGYRLLGNLEDFPDLFSWQVHFFTNLFRGRFTPEILQQLALHPDQFIDCFNHMHRDTDCPCLVCDGPCDCLSDPPSGISGELETFGEVELFNRFDQTHIPFLDQVEEEHTAADVAFGDTYHEAEVRFSQTAFSNFVPFINFFGEFNFLLRTEQIDPADFLQVHPYRIVDLDAGRSTHIMEVEFFIRIRSI